MSETFMAVPARSLQVGDSIPDIEGTPMPIVSVITGIGYSRVFVEGRIAPLVYVPGGNVRIVPNPELDRSSSASCQHYIETGRYLTHAEVAEFATTPKD